MAQKDQKGLRKKELEKFDAKNKEMREGLREKQAAKQASQADEEGKHKAWGQEQIQAEDKKIERSKQQKKDFKKKKKQTEKEIEEFRKRKDADADVIKEKQEQRKEERKAQLEYLKEMSDKNRWAVNIKRRDREAEEEKESTKIEANREAKQKQLQATAEERRAKKDLAKDMQKARGKADIHEKENAARLRDEARAAQVKLNTKEKVEMDQLDMRVQRERLQTQRYPNPAQKRQELRKVETKEKRERDKIRKKYIKLGEKIEVDTNKDIARFKQEAKQMRSKASTSERKESLALEQKTRDTRRQADKDAILKKRDAEQHEKDILTEKITEEED